MKTNLKDDEVLFDPILAEVYRIRDAYARKYKFNIDAICDALSRPGAARGMAPRVTRRRNASHRIPHE